MSNNGPAVPEEIGHKHTNIQTRKHANIVLLYKRDIATQCLFASMYVCLQPISSITAGLIWLNFFVSSILVTGWF